MHARLPEHHVFLVPGFFGFVNLGEFKYFEHVRDVIAEGLGFYRGSVILHRVQPPPTASLGRRAAQLLETVRAVDLGPGSTVHLVGHSAGGLDARLLASPGRELPGQETVSDALDRLRTVVTVTTPHHGTPIASFFTTLFGKEILLALSVFTFFTLRFGQVPLALVRAMTVSLALPRRMWGRQRENVESGVQQVIRTLGPRHRKALRQFMRTVAADQSLIPQLTPESAELINTGLPDRPGVRYLSVLARGRRAGFRTARSVGASPLAQGSHALYASMSRLASRMPRDRLPTLAPAQAEALKKAFGSGDLRRDNDAVVPTLSQVWGEVLATVEADHLDVLGHFGEPSHEPPHYDWLHSGSRFQRREFEALWAEVVRRMRDAAV